MSMTLSFEEAFKSLEEVVQKLEDGTATLDEALDLYTVGTELAAHCEGLLRAARLRVHQLQQDADGGYVERPFPVE